MSLAEIIGTPKYKKEVEPKINVPSPAYQQAVQQVKKAEPGTLISRAPVTTVSPAVPTIVKDMITNPLPTIISAPLDFWAILIGSREDKVIGVSKYIPGEVKKTSAYDIAHPDSGTTITQSFSDVIKEKIDESKKVSPEAKDFWEQPVIGGSDISTPGIEIPDIFGGIGDTIAQIGKYGLILVGAGLVGIYLITRKQ